MYSDPREDPEAFKRKRSGFWRHDYDHLADADRWTCDVKKLREEVGRAMMNGNLAERIHKHGLDKYLDISFGEGTASAYRTKLEGDATLVRMDFDRFAQQRRRDDAMDAMAYAARQQQMATNPYFYNTGTTSSTATAASTFAKKNLTFIQDNFMKDEIKRQQTKMITDTLHGTKVRKDTPFKFARKLIKTFPFKAVNGSLVENLQREFDHWAGDQMKVVSSV